jgi:hypothetical protein
MNLKSKYQIIMIIIIKRRFIKYFCISFLISSIFFMNHVTKNLESKKEIIFPIFIVGFIRSGTTLIRAILDVHPLIKCGPETKSKFFYFIKKSKI